MEETQVVFCCVTLPLVEKSRRAVVLSQSALFGKRRRCATQYRLSFRLLSRYFLSSVDQRRHSRYLAVILNWVRVFFFFFQGNILVNRFCFNQSFFFPLIFCVSCQQGDFFFNEKYIFQKLCGAYFCLFFFWNNCLRTIVIFS